MKNVSLRMRDRAVPLEEELPGIFLKVVINACVCSDIYVCMCVNTRMLVSL